MAKRATNPQEIQAIQKSLIAGVQSGAIQPYVGIPLIQDLTKKMTEAKAKMAQSMAGAGMPQPQQGGAPQQPIADQVMAQATQESQGLEALPSNLPESYAGGGIIAFEEGGPVERYQNTGLVSPTPAGRFFSGIRQNFSEEQEAAKLRNQLQMKYGPASALPGLFMTQTDEERQMAKQVAQALPNLSMEQLLALEANGPSALANLSAPSVKPTATPAANINQDLGPVPGTTGQDVLGGRPNAAAPSALPGAPSAGIGAFKMPPMQTFMPKPAVLQERTMGPLTDLNSFVKDLPEKTKEATETAITKTQKTYEDMDRPGFEAREGRLGKREATQEKDSAIGRALNLMNLGFGIAGSKERTLAGALGNEGRQGIRDLIQGEAANRAARDKLEDYRDNLEQQKVAAKKGNYQAAQAAGDRAADNLYKYQNLNMTAATAGNNQAIQRQQVEQQGDVNRATVTNQGQQIQQGAVSEQNRNALAAAGLGLQAQQLAQTGVFQTKQLAAMDKRYAALDKQSQARMAQVRAGAMSKFMETQGGQLNAQLAKEYGPNWRTSTDPRSLQAQMLFKQAQNAYIMDALGQYETTASARDSSDL
jgi:hypothetical protein